jgi:hypothetical protein
MNNIELNYKLFTMNELSDNINKLSLITILHTQILTYEFIINYILNNKYQITPEEQYITIDIVLMHQSHINELELNKLRTKIHEPTLNKD